MVEIQSKQDVWGSIPVSSSGKQIFDLAMHLKVDLLSVTHPGSPSMIFSVLWLIKTNSTTSFMAIYPLFSDGGIEN